MGRVGIRGVVFDIGGVLEITPSLGVQVAWARRLGLTPDELAARTRAVWQGGSIGTLTEAGVHDQLGALLGLDPSGVREFMADIWTEYLGTLNTELYGYFRSLRPRYRTGLLSNSFVGAREREQQRYRFGDSADVIVYSHEVGLSKPDPRVYELTCERLGVPPDEVVYVDDVEAAVTGARRVGMHAIRFEDTARTIAAVEARLRSDQPGRP
jgi:epoxide hydrolase-like predicted phosphatase